ncbi:MAG: hypothetical protein AAGH17_07455 [Pseudomonadota bacterium]
MILKYIKSRLSSFRKDTRGVAALEAIILLPTLAMIGVAGVVFFEGYRLQNDSLRASYAVADAIAREKEPITNTYIKSMRKMLDHMVPHDGGLSLRITIVCYSEKRGKYRVAWSSAKGSFANLKKHTHHTIHKEAAKLPDMPYGDQVIVVETFAKHAPSLSIGIPARDISNFVVVRPRFVNQVKFAGKDKWICKGG